jgi:hypothetical protein
MMTDGILAAQLSGGGIGTPGGIGADSVQKFQDAYNAATNRIDGAASEPTGSGLSSLLNPLLGLNSDSMRLSQQANHATQTVSSCSIASWSRTSPTARPTACSSCSASRAE